MSPEITDRILIVDDEFDNRELLEVIFKWDGFLVLTAASGKEALATVAQYQPDLVLLDMMMPGMDGCEVTINMKANLATKNIPVLILTALYDQATRICALAAGAEDVLTKPVARAELCARVRSFLRPRTAAPACSLVVTASSGSPVQPPHA